MDVEKVLRYALDREKEGYTFFSGHASRAQHAAVKGVFERLAREEQSHIRYVEHLLAGLAGAAPTADEPVELDPHRAGFFEARAISELIEQTTVEAMVPDLPVLRMAFLIERDLAEYYTGLAGQAEGEVRQALERLAAWEREHERLFRTLHDRVFSEYSGMPWGG